MERVNMEKANIEEEKLYQLMTQVTFQRELLQCLNEISTSIEEIELNLIDFNQEVKGITHHVIGKIDELKKEHL